MPRTERTVQLADLANLTQPWAIDPSSLARVPEFSQFSLARGFKNAPQPPAIAYDELECEYARLLGIPAPIVEMPFVTSWMLFRVSTVPALPCAPADIDPS